MADAQHPRNLGALAGPRPRWRQGAPVRTRTVADAGADEPAEPVAASRSLDTVAMPVGKTHLAAYRAVPELSLGTIGDPRSVE